MWKMLILLTFIGLATSQWTTLSTSAEVLPTKMPLATTTNTNDNDTIAEGLLPHQVSIGFYCAMENYTYQHHCGGSILHNRWIITAARCFDINQPWVVLAGISDMKHKFTGQTFKIQKIKRYPSVRGKNLALVKVDRDITFNHKVRRIELDTTYIKDEDQLVVSGWGKEGCQPNIGCVPGITPDSLQFFNGSSISNNECKSILHGHSTPLQRYHLCVFSKNVPEKHLIDLGAPLVKNSKLIGISDYVRGCSSGLPDVYTRVYDITVWLKLILTLH